MSEWAWLLLACAPLVAACSGSPTSAEEGACSQAANEGLPSTYALTVRMRDTTGVFRDGPIFRGTRAVWDQDPDGWVALGPEDTGEPVGQLGMTTTRPDEGCEASVVTAVMSTTDVRVGTAEEINGKLYELVNPGQVIQVLHINANEFVGRLVGLELFELIIRPTEPPRYGDPIRINGEFVARKPGR